VFCRVEPRLQFDRFYDLLYIYLLTHIHVNAQPSDVLGKVPVAYCRPTGRQAILTWSTPISCCVLYIVKRVNSSLYLCLDVTWSMEHRHMPHSTSTWRSSLYYRCKVPAEMWIFNLIFLQVKYRCQWTPINSGHFNILVWGIVDKV